MQSFPPSGYNKCQDTNLSNYSLYIGYVFQPQAMQIFCMSLYKKLPLKNPTQMVMISLLWIEIFYFVTFDPDQWQANTRNEHSALFSVHD